MRVIVDPKVTEVIWNFYEISMQLHPTLDYVTVENKVRRLYRSLKGIGEFPGMCPLAQFREDWKTAKYRDHVIEDFHFAYKVMHLETGEKVVKICDATHSLLYHD